MSESNDYNRTRSGAQYHGTNHASRMGQFDRMEAEARDRANIAARNAVSYPQPTYTPISFSTSGQSSSTTRVETSGRAQRAPSSYTELWICLACAGVWFGSAVAIASFLEWVGVSAALASKIGLWTLPALIGAAIAAFVAWALWHLAVAIAKGTAATWRAAVEVYRWTQRHRKPLGVTALYVLCVTGVYQLAVVVCVQYWPAMAAQRFKLFAGSALFVPLIAVATLAAIWMRSKVKARSARMAVSRQHQRDRIEPTYVWKVTDER
jgi:hypothetical protein